MLSFQTYNTFALLFSAVLFAPPIVSSQALSSTTKLAPTPTSSYQKPSMATTQPSYGSKYNFTYPKHQFEETIATSYKDTIDVSWTTTAPLDHLPVLHIACWFRNQSADYWLNHFPDLTVDIYNVTDPTVTHVPVMLEPYKVYEHCHFTIFDTLDKIFTNDTTTSSEFTISDTNNSKGQLWSLENKAPVVNLTAPANSAAVPRIVGGALVSAVSIAALGMMLVAL
ncbi:hypothetical protein N7G274_010540 [Stereocaulon virgatum]|uniref:Uncharacterized protein n=1 Tax=Stereocaulon virgatum TaxID=373712 RepID=A0ABR3ZUH0_9LECA